MAFLDKKKKQDQQKKTGSDNTAISSSKAKQSNTGSFSQFVLQRSQQERENDIRKYGEQAAAKRAAIDGALRIAQQNRKAAPNPVTVKPQESVTQSNTKRTAKEDKRSKIDVTAVDSARIKLRNLADQAVVTNYGLGAGRKASEDRERRKTSRQGYNPSNIKIDQDQLAEFAQY